MTKIQISKLLIVLLVVVAIVGLAHAQTTVNTELAGPVSNIGQYLAAVIKWSARLGTVAAVLVIVYAGFQMISSGGSPEGVNQAKELIQGALIGLITIFLIGALLTFLVDTSQFSNPSATPPSSSAPSS